MRSVIKKLLIYYMADFYQIINYNETEDYILYSDLQDHLQDAIKQLPEKHREAFMLNRFSNLKYKEIAERLQISERSVEDRISKALTQLRIKLKDFFIFLLFLY